MRVFRDVVTAQDTDVEVKMSPHAEVIKVDNGSDPSKVDFWWISHGDDAYTIRRFRVFGTGHSVPEDYIHVGTSSRNRAGLVWHLFEHIKL